MNKRSGKNRIFAMTVLASSTAAGVFASLAAVGLVLPAGAAAQEAPEARPLVIEAENLMANDARHVALAEAGRDSQAMLAGDIVRYGLTFTNTTEVPVRAVEFIDPVPEGLLYVAETAAADREDVLVEFSIDGGESYTAQPMVVEVVNGERVERPAPPDRYTHIRWIVTGWVQPGAQVTAQFEATL